MNHLRQITLTLLAAAGLSLGQWDPNQLFANTVKTGTAWGSVHLHLDSLDVDVSVGNGQVRTRATLTWTPDSAKTIRIQGLCGAPSDTFVDKVSRNCIDDTVYAATLLDSLELRSYFGLPQDAAVTGMWLWVGDSMVTAGVMDRWLASQQYNQIVGARRDPALLETWGGGSYNLSLFPLKSGQSRKLRIEVVQALKEGLVLPFAARQATVYTTGGNSLDTLRAAWVRLSLQSREAGGFTLDLGKLGNFATSGPLVSKIWQHPDAFVMTVSGTQPPVWTSLRDSKGAFGSAMSFRTSELRFDPEPPVRLVVLDVDDSLERVRRLALLALVKYGQAPYQVNLVWHDGTTLRRLWPVAKSMDAQAGDEALACLKSWRSSRRPDAKSVLWQVAQTDTGAVVVLVSTAPGAVFSLTDPGYPGDGSGASKVAAYQAYSDSSNRFWNQVSEAWNRVGVRMAGAKQTLFGWWNDGYAYNAAALTGGYGFGSVTNPWSRWRLSGGWVEAPALYGPQRYGYPEMPANLKLAISGLTVDSLATLFPSSWSIYRRGGVGIASPDVLASPSLFAARSTMVAYPGNGVAESLSVVFSARHFQGGVANILLSGTWGGLRFSGERTLQVPAPGGTEWGVRVWAAEYAGMQLPYLWSQSSMQAAVRQLGKAYGVVTAATSMLALEPGVRPLDSLPGSGSGTADMAVSGASDGSAMKATREDPAAFANASLQLDATGLDELLMGRVASVKPVAEVTPVGLRIRSGAVVELEVLGHDPGAARLRILDLRGREMERVAMVRSGDRWVASWRPQGRGVFYAVAEGALWKHTSAFTVGN